MEKPEVIAALRVGLQEALDLIQKFENQLNEVGPVDPMDLHKKEQLQQLLDMSGYVSGQHPLYGKL